MKLILGGHWAKAPDGWSALTERQLDITQPMPLRNETVDVIFTEHVIEHVNFFGGLTFMREALRVLKPGGIFRCVAPMTHVFATSEHPPAFIGRYMREQITPFYQREVEELSRMGLSLETDPQPWIIDSMVRRHGHLFCWSGPLMAAVLKKIGFSDSKVVGPGQSTFDKSTCIERTIRGTHAENFVRDFGPGITFDPESGVVEALK